MNAVSPDLLGEDGAQSIIWREPAAGEDEHLWQILPKLESLERDPDLVQRWCSLPNK